MAQKANPATRHVISINDLSDKDIDVIFEVAQSYLNELPDPNFSYRIGRSTKVASNYILAALFYEPSTRTRLSFESAMLRIGGQGHGTAGACRPAAARGIPLPGGDGAQGTRRRCRDRRIVCHARGAAPAVAVRRLRNRPRPRHCR